MLRLLLRRLKMKTTYKPEPHSSACDLQAPVRNALLEFCIDHLQHFRLYPCSFEYEDEGTQKVTYQTFSVLDVLSDKDKEFVETEAKKRAFHEAEKEWANLGSVFVDDNDQTLSNFLSFPKGTDIHEIWHWFEETYYKVSVAELMGVA
jgi:hypothetical protein